VRKRIIGIQVHHSVFLDDALRGAANACAGLDSAIVRTGNNDLIELLWRLRGLARELSEVRDRSRGRLLSLPKEQVIRCREGEEPWPDELPEGFVPLHLLRPLSHPRHGRRPRRGLQLRQGVPRSQGLDGASTISP